MFLKSLGFRIALVVILSLLSVETAVNAVIVYRQRQALSQKRLESLKFSVGLLESPVAGDIRHSRFQELTQLLAALARNFQADSFVLVDPQGKILSQASLKEDYQSRTTDLKVTLRQVLSEAIPPSEVFGTPGNQTRRTIFPMRDDQGKVFAALALEAPAALEDSTSRAFFVKSLGTAFLISLAIALFVTAIIMWILVNFVVKPINLMRAEMESLAKGDADLTFQMKVKTDDEIGAMAHGFNGFIDKIRSMVSRVMEHSGHLSEQVQSMTHSTLEVSAMSEDVTTTVQQIARGAEDQASKIAEVNHLMQEMQATMKEVEKEAVEASGAVDKATATARAGGKMARGTIDKMVELNGVLLKNSEMVSHLGVKSRQVGRVVEIISNIAEQTNLLSLNAAIEAARAGEQGRGFAVVAEEVRALADGASRATQEITGLVQEMQDETTAVVESMEKSAKEAQGGKEGIHQMESTLDEIITVIENVVQYSRNIKEMSAQQSQGYTKILHSIQDINAVSEESAASTEEVSASTQEQSASMEQVSATCKELAAMAQELKSMVEKFKIR